MWEAFRGYRDVYGRLPPARKVRRVTLYLLAKNERERELHEEEEQELERAKRQH